MPKKKLSKSKLNKRGGVQSVNMIGDNKNQCIAKGEVAKQFMRDPSLSIDGKNVDISTRGTKVDFEFKNITLANDFKKGFDEGS